ETTVWVNGRKVGDHRGGYDPFSFDITDMLKASGSQEIVLSVWDPTDKGRQARGKQQIIPEGFMYTPASGIWQTVWLEPVPKAYIRSLKIVPDVDKSVVRVTADVPGATDKHTILLQDTVTGKVVFRSVTGKAGQELTVSIDKPRLWSPDSPHLYGLQVLLLGNAEKSMPVDSVKTYFGMRKIAMAKDASGVNRLFLNGKALFQYGPLDQGWWPDGLYTAPTDEALCYDVEVLKKIGCNMIRKHVKIEPRRWYYHCDKLGMLVWQDMPNGNNKGDEGQKNFRRELKAMIDTHRNAPSIVMWVPFNEGWGQHDAPQIVKWIKQYDPTRLVNHASGWKDRGVGDVKDVHKYPGPGTAPVEEKRAIVLGEFGGLGLPVKDHLWWNKKNWGYRNFKTKDELAAAYSNLISRLHPMIGRGLAAAVYTQTTDVEGEVNGLMTY
ncbi:MAG: beta-galactosidase, partial [Planctomycetes bacterium]|nr:beta-galactosidase [Planctomycetota bacterium]